MFSCDLELSWACRDVSVRPVTPLEPATVVSMEWTEPVLVEHEVHVGRKRRRVLARIGFPRQIADREWICPFQVHGTGDKRREFGHGALDRAISIDGLHALWNGCYAIRYLLDRLKDVHASGAPYEFAFPVFLPTSDTRHGVDFYRELTHTLVAEIRRSGITQPEPTPLVETLARSTWSEPTIFEERLAFGAAKQTITARIGFPYFLAGDNTWACSFQLEGLDGGSIRRVRGENGLFAVARATKVIRESFDALESQSLGTYYELLFPAYLPTVHGLELHQRLRKLLDAERARSLRDQLRAHDARRRREQKLAARKQESSAGSVV
jgi:hypothetical protein